MKQAKIPTAGQLEPWGPPTGLVTQTKQVSPSDQVTGSKPDKSTTVVAAPGWPHIDEA